MGSIRTAVRAVAGVAIFGLAVLPAASRASTQTLELESAGQAIEVQADGKLIAAGLTQPCTALGVVGCSGSSIFVARYSRLGKPDRSFGQGDGFVTLPVGRSTGTLAGLALQPDGQIVVAGGGAWWTAANQLTLARLTADGALDPTFGSSGVVVTPAETFSAGSPNAIAVSSDGGILVAGSAPDPSGPRMAVARFTQTGDLDSSFGTSGIAAIRVESSGGGESANAVLVRPDGRIVLVGAAGRFRGPGPTTMSFGAAQFAPDGTPDPSFGGDGAATALATPSGSGPIARVEANAAALTAEGDLVLAGTHTGAALTRCDNYSLVAMTPSGEVDGAFGAGGYVSTSADYCSAASNVSVTPAGQLLVTGGTLGFESPRDPGKATVRAFASDGSIDPLFSSSGIFQRRFLDQASGSYAMTTDQTGSIFATGYVISDDCWRGQGHRRFRCRAFALIRLRPNGKPKRDFGFKGFVTVPPLCVDDFPPCKAYSRG